MPLPSMKPCCHPRGQIQGLVVFPKKKEQENKWIFAWFLNLFIAFQGALQVKGELLVLLFRQCCSPSNPGNLGWLHLQTFPGLAEPQNSSPG